EVGGGSGVALREIVRRTAGANPILDIDINPYLLREAAALAAREGLAERIEFRQGSAEALPLAGASVDVALSLTVMEERGCRSHDGRVSPGTPPRRADRRNCALTGHAVVVESATQPRGAGQGGSGRRPRWRRIAGRLCRRKRLRPILRRRPHRSALLP